MMTAKRKRTGTKKNSLELLQEMPWLLNRSELAKILGITPKQTRQIEWSDLVRAVAVKDGTQRRFSRVILEKILLGEVRIGKR